METKASKIKKSNHKNMAAKKIILPELILASLSLITIHKIAMPQEDGLKFEPSGLPI
jgi:hypothetical protein